MTLLLVTTMVTPDDTWILMRIWLSYYLTKHSHNVFPAFFHLLVALLIGLQVRVLWEVIRHQQIQQLPWVAHWACSTIWPWGPFGGPFEIRLAACVRWPREWCPSPWWWSLAVSIFIFYCHRFLPIYYLQTPICLRLWCLCITWVHDAWQLIAMCFIKLLLL